MKIYNINLVLIMVLMMNCSGKTTNSINNLPNGTESHLNEDNTGFTKVHSLIKNDSTKIGDIYVKYLNDTVFTELYVTNESDTLYSIKGGTLLNINGKDIEVFKDGFYGYLFVMKKNDYFVLSYLRNNGKNISDDISIEWNYDENILEVQKIP